MNNQAKSIASFTDGSIVQPEGLEGIMKNLTVLRVSDCSTLVRGMENRGMDMGWNPFEGYIANSTKVYYLGHEATKEKEESKNIEEINSKESLDQPKKRGRQKSPEPQIEWPKMFTMKDLVAKFPQYSHSILYVAVQKAIELGSLKIVDRITGGRGRAKIVYGIK